MEIQELAHGVHQATAYRTSWCLIISGDSVTIVDAGWPKDYDLVLESLSLIGHTPASVSGLLLTPGPVDPLGCAEEMRVKHEIDSHIHEIDAPLARGEKHEGMQAGYLIARLWKPAVFRFGMLSIGRGALGSTPLTEVETFTENGPLDLPGSPVPVHTPGHTSGHCSYHLPDRGVLITGDALVSMELWSERVEARIMPEEFNFDHARALGSLDRLESLDADLILTGHGPPYRGSPAKAVREARELG